MREQRAPVPRLFHGNEEDRKRMGNKKERESSTNIGREKEKGRVR